MVRAVAGWMIFLGAIGLSPAISDVVINEIMYKSLANELDSEYVELYNAGEQAADLSGWQFQDGIEFTFPQGTTIAGGGYLLVCRNEIFLRTFYNLSSSIHSVGNFAPSKLSNSGEEIGLYDENGVLMDRVEYSDSAPWPTQADGKGASLELVHPAVDNNNPLYWKASQPPTPGLPNTALAKSVPPRLQKIQRIPQSPTPNDAARIAAVFAVGDQLKSVSLNYQINGGAVKTAAMTAQGGAYIAEIPAQANGALVEYSITAVNNDGFTLTAPHGQAQSKYLYISAANPPAEGSVLINEIMYNNPSTDGEDHEWMELYNPGAQAIDLSYWGVRDSNDLHLFLIPKGTSIAAKGFLLIAKAKDTSWQAPTVTGFPYSLNDKGDSVRLYDPNDRLIAAVEFNDKGAWPKGADGEGGSLELIQANRPNGEPNNWAVSELGGTPGKANARVISDPNYRDYDVVINELFYHPENEASDDNLDKEYIELFNRSDQTIDLSGWYFCSGVEFTFPAGASIPAGGYLLVCRNVNQYPAVSNKIGDFILQLNNAGESVALANERGVVVDWVQYNDKYPWPTRPDGDGYSLELIVPTGDNSAHSNWRCGHPYSPGAPNSAILPSEPPHISDITHTPDYPTASISEQKTEETVIIKIGDSWRYLRGKQAPPTNWYAFDFDDSSWTEGPSGFGYSDNDDATVIDDMQNSYLGVYIRKTFTLSAVDGLNQVVLGVDYDDGFVAYLNGVEVARANVNGVPAYNVPATSSHEAGSMETFNITSSSHNLRVGKNVLAIVGLNNGLSSTDFSLIPSLSTTRVITGGEEGADSVLIAARVKDSAGLAEVKLNYQRCNSPYGTGLVLNEWKTVPMFDDGTGGDATAGDGIYSYRFNYAETLYPREVWRYTISAKNKTGQETTMPLPGEKTETRAFFVEDRLDKPAYPTVYFFAERTVLDWLSRNPDSNQEQPCIVVIDGKVYDLLNAGGIRYSGEDPASKPQKSWKIQFAKDNRWKGRRVVHLNANYQTSALLRGEAGFLENLANEFVAKTGLPTKDVFPYRLVLNTSYYGLFLGVEPYSEEFLDKNDLPAETRVFRAGVKSKIANLAPEINQDVYAQKYENALGDESDLSDLITFIEGMSNASDLKAFFEANLDVKKYLDFLTSSVVLSYVDNNEGNYYLVHAVDGRWYVLPGNMDHTWGEMETNTAFPLVSSTSVFDGADGGLWGINQLKRRFLGVAEYRQMYCERLRDLVDHEFTREHLDAVVDAHWNYISQAIRENVQRWNMAGQIDSMVAEIKKYITARREFILKEIGVTSDQTPAAPVNGSPAEGAVLTKRGVTLLAEVPISRAPIMMEWEIQKGNADFAYPLWSKQGNENMPTTLVPATVLAPGGKYYWRVRYQVGVKWSYWSAPTSFGVAENLAVPDVENVTVTALDRSARLEWTLPVASDLARVDIYQDNSIVESAPITDNRVRITGLDNGVTYTFVIKVVSTDLRSSTGVSVKVKPVGPIAEGNTIAYFRFEGDAKDTIGLFPDGQLLGSAAISAPGAANPVPLTQQANTASLQLAGAAGAGFQFGSSEPYLDVTQRMTLECYAMFSLNAITPGVLFDRYDETHAIDDGVWRFGVGLSNLGSIDFFFNDGDVKSGYSGRFHAAASGGVAPYDGLFHHYAAVVDLSAASAADKVAVYLDGIRVPTTIINEDGVSSYKRLRTDSDLPVILGARRTQTGTADAVPGRIDEARITSGVLTPKQFLVGPTITAVQDWALY